MTVNSENNFRLVFLLKVYSLHTYIAYIRFTAKLSENRFGHNKAYTTLLIPAVIGIGR